jgi:ABC-type branched-subunit amino acid transport system substrate-binding protein
MLPESIITKTINRMSFHHMIPVLVGMLMMGILSACGERVSPEVDGDEGAQKLQAILDQIESKDKSAEEYDPALASEALAAAFAQVRSHTGVSDNLIRQEGDPVEVIAKPDVGIRAAVLIPLTGRGASIGKEMRRGAELAIFTLNNPNVDLTFHDTSIGIDKAMNAAIQQNADVIIGPLFGEDTKQAKSIARAADIPILSFSNDSAVAGDGAWLIGQTPEQEIEAVVRHALDVLEPIDKKNREHLSVALVVQDNDYGRRISQHAIDILLSHDGVTAEMLTLNRDILANEATLRESVGDLTKWSPELAEKIEKAKAEAEEKAKAEAEEKAKAEAEGISVVEVEGEGEGEGEGDGEEELLDYQPLFDTVIIAGDVSFGLRVAPVLSWYELDSAKVRFLGTSHWATASILQEPSLEGGWFAGLPASQAEQFQSLWNESYDSVASNYAIMAFDAVALVSTLSPNSPSDLFQALTEGSGFNGFSGAFKLEPNGQNIRQLEIRKIKTGDFDVIRPAKTNFN